MIPSKVYTFTVPANGAYPLQVTGRYVRVQSCTNSIGLNIDGIGTLGTVGAGQGFMLRENQPVFQRLLFTDSSGSANNVTIIIADSSFIDNTVLGSVSVVDGGKARTLANAAYVASLGVTSDATTGPAAYLRNPAGSGKNIIVKSIRVSFSTATSYGVSWATGVTGADQSAISIVSKSNSGSFAGKVNAHTTGAKAGTTQNSLATAILAANSVDAVTFAEPVVITQGNQIVIFGTSVSTTMLGVLECVEEAVT